MVKYIFISLIFSMNLYADVCKAPSIQAIFETDPETNDLLKVLDKPDFAVDEEQFEKANCKPRNLSKNKIKRILKTKSSEELWSDLYDLINTKDKSLFSDDFEHKFDLAPLKKQCQNDALCAVKKIFGKSGTRLLYLKAEYGLNGSHLVHQEARAWTDQELKVALKTLRYIPKKLYPKVESKQFIRTSKDNGSTIADASITFYKRSDEMAKNSVSVIVLHELGHYFAGVDSDDHSQDWLLMSQWSIDFARKLAVDKILDQNKKPSSTLFSSKPVTFNLGNSTFGNTQSQFLQNIEDDFREMNYFFNAMSSDDTSVIVSKYAEKNPAEDFAETFIAYRIRPDYLKEVSPKKYQYMKDYFFKGYEFLTEDDCKDLSP
jgi:hypothetical protein